MNDWSGFLAIADELSERSEAAAQRTAISRAYYAAFHVAKRWLEARGQSFPSDTNVHQFVWQAFRESPSSEQQDIGEDGNALRRVRNLADYDDAVRGLPRQCVDAFDQATALIERINSLPRPPGMHWE